MKKREAEPMFIEVNDGQRVNNYQGSAILAKRPFKKRRFKIKNARRNNKKQSSAPRNISRVYQVYLGRVFKNIENFVKMKKRKQGKEVFNSMRIWVKRNKHYNPIKFLNKEEKNQRLRKLFILMRCKMAEKQSSIMFLMYKKFILLKLYEKFGCRSILKKTKMKLRDALEILKTHNSDQFDKELKIKYGVINLSNLIFRIKTTFFGILHDKCRFIIFIFMYLHLILFIIKISNYII